MSIREIEDFLCSVLVLFDRLNFLCMSGNRPMKRNNMNNMKRILLLLLSLFVLANGMVGANSGERIHHVFNEGDFLYWVEHADPGDEIEVCASARGTKKDRRIRSFFMPNI